MLWKQPMTKVTLEISVTFGPPSPLPQVRDFNPVTPLGYSVNNFRHVRHCEGYADVTVRGWDMLSKILLLLVVGLIARLIQDL